MIAPLHSTLPAVPSRSGFVALLLGGFLTVFDLFVVNVALPSIRIDLGADLAGIGLVVALYQLAFGVLLIAGGRMGDRYGRRRLFVLGMIGFAFASLLCGIAPDTTILVLARGLQGAMGAILFPQIYALLRAGFDDDGRRRAFARLGMTLGLAAIAGQVLGGLMVEGDLFGLGWRIVFLVNLPVVALAAALARGLPDSREPNAGRVDCTGIGLATIGLALLLVPLLEGPETHWPDWTWECLAAAFLVLAGFVAWQWRMKRTGREPAVDLALFGRPAFAAGAAVVLIVYAAAASFFLGFALFAQAGLGLSPFAAGCVFAPASVAFVAASLLAPRLSARLGAGAIAGGALLYAAGIGVTAVLAGRVAGGTPVIALVPALTLFGFGQGLSMTPLLNLVTGLADAERAGMAAGLVSTVQQLGGAFGIAIGGIVFAQMLGPVPDGSGYAQAFAATMAVHVAALVVAVGLIVRFLSSRTETCR